MSQHRPSSRKLQWWRESESPPQFDPRKPLFLRMWRWLDFVRLPGSSSIRTWCDCWGSFLIKAFILLRSSWRRYKNTCLCCFSCHDMNKTITKHTLFFLFGNYCLRTHFSHSHRFRSQHLMFSLCSDKITCLCVFSREAWLISSGREDGASSTPLSCSALPCEFSESIDQLSANMAASFDTDWVFPPTCLQRRVRGDGVPGVQKAGS